MKLRPPSPSELGDRLRDTEVWKSIFRPGSIFRKGYKDTSRDRALATMNNVLYHLHPVKLKRHGLKLTYTFCLGGLSFFLFILLTITGIFLMFFYRPTADIGGAQAFTDMQAIRTSVFFGDLVRNLHRWGARGWEPPGEAEAADAQRGAGPRPRDRGLEVDLPTRLDLPAG
ncbi:MAG TPA: hypothetical protein VF108_09460, partial [Actinomycetota bacterium]